MLMTVENCTQLHYLYWVHPYNDFYQKFLEVEHQEKDVNIHILVHLLVSFVKFFSLKIVCVILPYIFSYTEWGWPWAAPLHSTSGHGERLLSLAKSDIREAEWETHLDKSKKDTEGEECKECGKPAEHCGEMCALQWEASGRESSLVLFWAVVGS